MSSFSIKLDNQYTVEFSIERSFPKNNYKDRYIKIVNNYWSFSHSVLPSCIKSNGYTSWNINGFQHRDHGPSTIYSDGRKSYVSHLK
jgi:hypothetical protein